MIKTLVAVSAVAVIAACGRDNGNNDVDAAPTTKLVQIDSSDLRSPLPVEAVREAEVGAMPSGPASCTVLAPSDDAFAELLAEPGSSNGEPLADEALPTVLFADHALPQQVQAAQVPPKTWIATRQGGSFSIDAGLLISDQCVRPTAIVATDVMASNGVILVIDGAILA